MSKQTIEFKKRLTRGTEIDSRIRQLRNRGRGKADASRVIRDRNGYSCGKICIDRTWDRLGKRS